MIKLDDVKMVKEINNSTNDGIVIDGDTILADIIENMDIEVSGVSNEILDIWELSEDKKAVEDLFNSLLGISFEEYINKCKEKISK